MIGLTTSLLLAILYCVTAQSPSATPASTTSSPTSAPWGGCVDPKNPNNATSLLKIGDPTTVCLTIGPGGSWTAGVNYLRFMFQPKTDQYSRFYIPNSYRDLVNSANSPLTGNMTVHSASQTMLSFLRVYYNADAELIFPYLTAIIDVDKGIVQGISWDNACVFCSKDLCLENTFDFNGLSATERQLSAPSKGCYFTRAQCNVITNSGQRDCDLTLYVVWTGTDVDGGVMQSSSSRFSAFPPAKLEDRVFNSLPDLPSFGF